MASKTPDFTYDAIILHGEEESEDAKEFCEMVQAKIDLDRPLKIITFEEFSILGKTVIQNLEDAIEAGWFIFCSEYFYHTDLFGTFSGQVAIQEKIPDRFVKISTGRTDGESAIMRTFHGIQLQENWKMSAHALDKLKKLFSNIPGMAEERSTHRDEDQNTAMPELPTVGPFDPQESLSELLTESYLEVSNPSLSMSSSTSGKLAGGSSEAEHQTVSPRLIHRSGKSKHNAQTSKSQCSKGCPDTTMMESTDLRGDDVEEDARYVMTNATETNNVKPSQTSEKAQVVDQSEGSANPAVASSTTDENGEHAPSRQELLWYCFVFCCIAGIVIFEYYIWNKNDQ